AGPALRVDHPDRGRGAAPAGGHRDRGVPARLRHLRRGRLQPDPDRQPAPAPRARRLRTRTGRGPARPGAADRRGRRTRPGRRGAGPPGALGGQRPPAAALRPRRPRALPRRPRRRQRQHPAARDGRGAAVRPLPRTGRDPLPLPRPGARPRRAPGDPHRGPGPRPRRRRTAHPRPPGRDPRRGRRRRRGGAVNAPRPHHLADMTSEEARRAAEADTVVLIPAGAFEQHGPALPLGTDLVRAEGVVERVAARLDGRAVIGPALPVGVSPHHLAFPGTLSLSVDTFRAVLREYLAGLSAHGWRRILVVTGHGGNNAALTTVAQDLLAEEPGLQFAWTPLTP